MSSRRKGSLATLGIFNTTDYAQSHLKQVSRSLQQIASRLVHVGDHALRPDAEEDGDGSGADQRDADAGWNFRHGHINIPSWFAHVHDHDHTQVVIGGNGAVY